MPSRSGHPRTPHPLASVRYRKRSPDRWPLVWCRHRWYARASWRCSRSLGWARTQAMAGRSTARTSSPVSPPSRRPGRSPRSQPPMTARAVACGSTPTLAQVSVGQARWSPPPAVLVPDRVDELAGEHHPVGVEREPDHQRAQPRPDHLDGLAETNPHLQRAEHADGHVPGHVRHSAGVTPPRERDLRQRAGRAARVGPGPGRDRPHPTAPLAPRESGSAYGHSDRTRGRLHREISQSLPVQPVVVSEPTRPCCMANSVAAARLETPAFA
jgi:hypothetical protein